MSILQLDSRLELTQFQWLASCGSDKVVAYLSKIDIVLEKYKRTKSLVMKRNSKMEECVKQIPPLPAKVLVNR